MKRMSAGIAPRSFHSLFRDGVSTGLSDKELLERFARSRDASAELAFATLVARHGPMVPAIVSAPIVNLVFGATQSMTISKLAMAASLLVFTGLAAWGAASLAAQTPRSSGSEVTQPALASLSTTERSRAEATAPQNDAGDEPEISVPDDLPPVVIKVEPKVGATDVDPSLKELRVTFSKKMTDKSWSWPTGNKYAAPKDAGPIHFERDGRTCVMPVKLEPGKTYVIGVNSERFRNFKDTKGHPALPYLFVFRTKQAN
jgi:RNA polymerase sigma-70 factor (ECF subfamily)